MEYNKLLQKLGILLLISLKFSFATSPSEEILDGSSNHENNQEIVNQQKRIKDEDQSEKIAILWAARKSKETRWQRILTEIESLKAQNHNQTVRINQLENKLDHLETGKKRKPPIRAPNDQSQMNDLQEPPSNCNDLFMIGYNLAGFYLVQDKVFKKITTLFCDFKSSPLLVENKIGYVSIKSFPNGIHFYVQRKSNFDKRNAIIPFEKELLNEGGAMNVMKGIFTAPVSGIYHFQFKGENNAGGWKPTDSLDVLFRLNGQVIGNAHATVDPLRHFSCSVHATLKLKRGDRVDLLKREGTLHEDSTPDTHFTGTLLEEDIVSFLE